MSDANNSRSQLTPSDILEAHFVSFFTLMLRGTINFFPMAGDEIMILACRVFGTVIASSWAGDPEKVKKFRSRCRVEFSGAMHEVPIQELRKPPETPLEEKIVAPAAETPQAAA